MSFDKRRRFGYDMCSTCPNVMEQKRIPNCDKSGAVQDKRRCLEGRAWQMQI